MHSISPESGRFGRIIDVKNGGGYSKNSEFMYAELLDWEKVGIPTELFTKEEHEKIRSLFLKAAPYLDEVTLPRLVHTDLWAGNILVSEENGRNSPRSSTRTARSGETRCSSSPRSAGRGRNPPSGRATEAVSPRERARRSAVRCTLSSSRSSTRTCT